MSSKKLFVKNKLKGEFLFMGEVLCNPIKSKADRLIRLEKEKVYHESHKSTFKLASDFLAPYFDFTCKTAVLKKKEETLTLTDGPMEKTYFFI